MIYRVDGQRYTLPVLLPSVQLILRPRVSYPHCPELRLSDLFANP